MEGSDFLVMGAIAGFIAIANPTPNSRAMPTKTNTRAPGECNCTEYVSRRAGIPDVNKVRDTNENTLKAAGYSRTAYPRPGGIALLEPGIPNLTKPNSGHIAYIESVDDGIPTITDSNSGGTDSSYGCNNVRTSRRENYFSNGVTFWAKD